MQERSLLHEQSITHRYRTLRSDIPGALAILCAVAFGTGIIDEDVRETLPLALWGSFAGTFIFWALFRYARRPLLHRLSVFGVNDEVFVSVDGPSIREEFGPGFSWSHGVFIEHIDAHVAARDAPVAWVQFRSKDGRSLTVRYALGILHDVPRWPEAQVYEAEARVFSGDPIALHNALRAAE
jgi:hypothetical protein